MGFSDTPESQIKFGQAENLTGSLNWRAFTIFSSKSQRDVKQYARIWGLSMGYPHILHRKQLTARMRALNPLFPQRVLATFPWKLGPWLGLSQSHKNGAVRKITPTKPPEPKLSFLEQLAGWRYWGYRCRSGCFAFFDVRCNENNDSLGHSKQGSRLPL